MTFDLSPPLYFSDGRMALASIDPQVQHTLQTLICECLENAPADDVKTMVKRCVAASRIREKPPAAVELYPSDIKDFKDAANAAARTVTPYLVFQVLKVIDPDSLKE